MSLQAKDIFNYNEKKYYVSAIQKPQDFFNIEELGIKPVSETSGCWRGYIAKFSILDNRLVLHELATNNDQEHSNSIPVNNIHPKITIPYKGNTKFKHWDYKNIELHLSYSGAIIITNGFIKERLLHTPFYIPITSYSEVIELSFDKGVFTGEKDLSDIVFQVYDRKKPLSEDDRTLIPNWIKHYFDY